MKKRYYIFTLLAVIIAVIVSFVIHDYYYHELSIKNEKNEKKVIDKEFRFSNASYKMDKRIHYFLDEYFNDEELNQRESYKMYIKERKDGVYITIINEIEKFQSSLFKPSGVIGWNNKRIYVILNTFFPFKSDEDDLLNEFRNSDIMNTNMSYIKFWLLVIDKYNDSYTIIKDKDEIRGIMEDIEIKEDKEVY